MNRLTSFARRHIANDINDRNKILEVCKAPSINNFINEVNYFNRKSKLNIKQQVEHKALSNLNNILNKNIDNKCFIGMGYYNTLTPLPIKRHILENPKWYTAYTPYQPEISQGRLESQHNFQTVVSEITGLPISNASLLDQASSAVEVMNMCNNYYKQKRKIFIVSNKLFPQVLEVLKTRAKVVNIDLQICDLNNLIDELDYSNIFGVMFQYPDNYGNIDIPYSLIEKCNNNNVLVTCASDLLALTQIIDPKSVDVDICYGSAQRFGVPLWYGGPHPAFLSTNKKLLRYIPGRIIGKSKDKLNNDVYRIGLQTREQHIRRDKATSNICTSQSLLTNVVAMYAIYHGKDGIRDISKTIIDKTYFLKTQLKYKLSLDILYDNTFDTICIKTPYASLLYSYCIANNIVLRKVEDDILCISIDETTEIDDCITILNLFAKSLGKNIVINKLDYYKYEPISLPNNLKRTTEFMENDLFKRYQDETSLLRYIYKLSQKDFTLCDGMIPLGSCTMKLNSVSQLEPLSSPKITNFHPYLPRHFVKGYHEMIDKLSYYLEEITGFKYVSYQSNSGAMGEYSGLLTIKRYFELNNKSDRNICLIPDSAHGTNFASANLANLKIMKYDDSDDLSKVIEPIKDKLACIMITYPSTNGIFQYNIEEICELIHNNGGLVYMDGANMNALTGIIKPAEIGVDICHLNLHKTYCIPHGGGGPGMGPILCNDRLASYLPINKVQQPENNILSYGSITSSNWSSASLLSIPYMYISMMGNEGLKNSSINAILNANYLKESLKDDYTIIDVNKNGRVAHEFIIDISNLKKINITENDIAKRLIDYSFHPPTMSWPRMGVLMFEPTESESKEELDRLVLALKSIRKEIYEIDRGEYSQDDNVLKNAPHNIQMIKDWNYPYSFEKAFYPVDYLNENKFWPSVARVDDVYGDKQMMQ
jgi:glycine dehydrogenase